MTRSNTTIGSNSSNDDDYGCEYVYVIRLEDDCFYVGRTKNVEQRYLQHLKGSSSSLSSMSGVASDTRSVDVRGASWTMKHKPIELVMKRKMVGLFDEDNKVKALMIQYGIDKVRGGTYSMCNLPEFQVKALEAEFIHVLNKCFKCGKLGHYASTCGGTAKHASSCQASQNNT